MLQLKYLATNLAFEYPFTTHKGTKTHQPALLVALALGNIVGYGEAPEISYYPETVAGMKATLDEKKPMIERYALTDPGRFWHFLHHLIPGQHFLTAALDIAGWDAFAQMRRMPLYKLLGLEWANIPKCDYTIGIDQPEQMVKKLQEHPWPLYKIKVSSPDDIANLELLRQHTTAPFRVDANEGWSYEDAVKLLPELKKLGVTLVEQPLAKTEWEATAALKALDILPLYADESCCTETDVDKCMTAFNGINIKLTKCGGITPALRMIAKAKENGVKVMVGSMNESTIGSAAIAHLMPLLDEVDADGPLLLKEDIADGLTYSSDGYISISGRNGLGVRYTGVRQKQ